MTAPVRVRARGWGWRHGTRRAAAVQSVDLDIAAGERVLLLGPSGAGKSTLLAALAGLLGDDEDGEQGGELTLDGVPPTGARGRVGLVLQDPESQVVMARLGDEVAFGCENLGLPAEEIWPRVRSALDAVGLDLPLDHSTSELSGGQKQRLALASVVAMRPGLLLLDEPTAQIDPAGAIELRDAVGRAVDDRQTTLVVVEHRVVTWLDLIDRIVVLGGGGRLVADGPPAEVLQRHGAALAMEGVWVPALPPTARARRRPTEAPLLLTGSGLALGRRRFGERRPVEVAGPLDLTVAGGRALAVTGPNGTGKSTLALTVAGLQPAAGGELAATPALADGLGADPLRWRSRDLLTRIGCVFQDPRHQFLASTVRAELELGPRLLRLPESEVARRTDELLQRLRLDRLAAANPFTLSGGEQRRLSLATAIATEPRVLVVDEPTFGQDARTWAELADALSDLVDAGTALVAVSHDTAFVDALADAVLALPARERGAVPT